METIFNALNSVNPVIVLVAGMVLGAVATLAIVFWKSNSATKSDPLSNLFEGDTLQSQIARVADHAARSKRAVRDASVIRAKLRARGAAQATVPPHRADRYDHQAVLDHIAKVIRAGTQLEKTPQSAQGLSDEGEWEDVLLLPAPNRSTSSRKAA